MAREYFSRFQCAHPGCPEWTHYRSATRAEQAETHRTYQGKWRCVRHSQPEQMLSPDQPRIVYEVVSDQRPNGVYWGSWGFLSGPGFKAFAKDFPPGTMLRVTAEIEPPALASATSAAGTADLEVGNDIVGAESGQAQRSDQSPSPKPSHHMDKT